MRFLIELDGPVFDILPAWYAGHRTVAAEVGWSWLDQATFRRLIRAKGRDADLLSCATDVKMADYDRRFAEYAESDASIGTFETQPGVAATVKALAELGSCCAVTLGANVTARRALLDRAGLGRVFEQIVRLDADPRRRPGEVRQLSGGDDRTIVVAASDSLVRAAGGAERLAVALSYGQTGVARLHRAGADVIYKSLDDLVSSLKSGAKDLIQAGLLPMPLG